MPQLATLLRKRLWHRCFPVNFAEFLRTFFHRIQPHRWLPLCGHWNHLCTFTRDVLEVYNHCKKINFSVKDFFSKCEHIRNFLRSCSHLLKKPLTENFIFLQCLVRTSLHWSRQKVRHNVLLSVNYSAKQFIINVTRSFNSAILPKSFFVFIYTLLNLY